MLIASFTLTTPQLQVLLAFRNAPSTASTVGSHPMHDVDHTVSTLRKLCRDGYLTWRDADAEAGIRPGYDLSPKGEMMLRVVEDEVRRTLSWFDGGSLPKSMISGGASVVATGSHEFNKKGVAVKKKKGA